MSNDQATPLLAGAERMYAQFLKAGQFRIQRCTACHVSVFYPRQLCPECGHTELEWYAPAGQGRIYALSRVHHPVDASKSHDVALVDLIEGVRIMGIVIQPAQRRLGIGDTVQLALECFEDSYRIIFQERA